MQVTGQSLTVSSGTALPPDGAICYYWSIVSPCQTTRVKSGGATLALDGESSSRAGPGR